MFDYTIGNIQNLFRLFPFRNIFKQCPRRTREANHTIVELSHLVKKEKNDYTFHEDSLTEKIKLDELEEYFLSELEIDPLDNEISEQYHALPKHKLKECNIGTLPENRPKNRYKNIIPYDDTRVELLQPAKTNYINANFIKGFQFEKEFIATQAPMKTTINDFWHMINQQKVNIIVMLTELEENGREKCEPYWPSERGSKAGHGPFLIKNISADITSDYIHTKLVFYTEEGSRTIEHFQYTGWPDHAVPTNYQSFVTFLKTIASFEQESPIVVHCNAGCGRTGTYILCDIILKMALKYQEVNFVKILRELREQRSGLVNNLAQYIFAYHVVVEYFFGQEFSIAINDEIHTKVKCALEEEALSSLYTRLAKHDRRFLNPSLKETFTKDEIAKSRFLPEIPSNNRVYLSRSLENPTGYINAFSVDCYRYPEKFLVIEQPQKGTISDFWNLVHEYEISMIVSLNKFNFNDTNCPCFWNPETPLSKINLKVFQTTENKMYDTISIKLTNIKDSRIVTILDTKNWERECITPSNLADLIHVWERTLKHNNKILVTCYDGKTASGLFVTLAYLLERVNLDHICDVFSAISTTRKGRPDFIRHPEQVQYLYEAALEYLREFSTYGNFV